MMKMKRLGVVLLAASMTLSMAACGGKSGNVTDGGGMVNTDTQESVATSDAKGDAGTYTLYEYEGNGTTVSHDLLEQSGMGDSYLTLNVDGTGTFMLFNSEMDITWEPGVVTVYGTTKCDYTLKGDTLSLDMQGVTYVLKRDGSVVADAGDEKDTTEEDASESDVTEEDATESEDTEDDTTEAVDHNSGSDYGKSNADATGIVDFDTLKATFDWAKEETGYPNFASPTYEEYRDHFGADGVPWDQVFDNERHAYKWETEDGDFFYVTFKINDDGSETYTSSTWSSSLNDPE